MDNIDPLDKFDIYHINKGLDGAGFAPEGGLRLRFQGPPRTWRVSSLLMLQITGFMSGGGELDGSKIALNTEMHL